MFRNADPTECTNFAHEETEAQGGKEIAQHHTVKSKVRTQTQVPNSRAMPFPRAPAVHLRERADGGGGEVGW